MSILCYFARRGPFQARSRSLGFRRALAEAMADRAVRPGSPSREPLGPAEAAGPTDDPRSFALVA
jgi:hypothetical protein